MKRVLSLPHPFLSDHHAALQQRLRQQWTEPIEAVRASFQAGEIDEDAAARGFVQALATNGHLQRAIEGDVRGLCVAREECAYLSGFADSQLALQGLGSYPIQLTGDSELIRRYVVPAAAGQKIPAFALTEPEAGSDVRALQTRARRQGDCYVLNGEKTLITNAGVADYYTVFARLEDAEDTFVALVVDADTQGFQVAERYSATAPHPLGRLLFRDCEVPVKQRAGAEGDGLKLAFGTLDRFRPTVGAAALGLAMRALSEACAHVSGRQQFGRTLDRFQMIKGIVADRFADAELARLTVYRAAWLLDEQPTSGLHGMASALGKLTATEAAFRVVDSAVQLFGGRGVLRGEVVEALYRDVRALRIYEGTSEIQRLILAKGVMDDGRD